MTQKECFGFFNDSVSCNNCPAVKRCRAILVSDGFDVLAGLLSEIVEAEAESGIPFFPKEKVSDNVDQLLNRTHREALSNDESILEELFGDQEKADMKHASQMDEGGDISIDF